MKCLILLASYNGSQFIAKQIDSIIDQTFENWSLIIRDDGSTDNTLDILKEYEKKDKRITIILNRSGKHGAYQNFWALIEHARELDEYDLFFFSDQDDIWDKDKLECLIKRAKQEDEAKPLCIYTDMRTIDSKDNVDLESVNKTMGIELTNPACLFFSHAYIWGCTAAVNKALLKTMPMPDLGDEIVSILSHDNYMGKYAAVSGSLIYYDRPFISHRRYENNTTGEYKHKLSIKDVLMKSTVGLKKLAKTHARVYKQTLYAIERMHISGIESESTDKYENIIKKGGIAGFIGLLKLKIKRKQPARTIGIYFIMLFGLYKKYMKSRTD